MAITRTKNLRVGLSGRYGYVVAVSMVMFVFMIGAALVYRMLDLCILKGYFTGQPTDLQSCMFGAGAPDTLRTVLILAGVSIAFMILMNLSSLLVRNLKL